VMIGSAPASKGSRERDITVIGSTWDLKEVRHLKLRRGRFIPPGDSYRASPVVVLGEKLKKELFGNRNAVGAWVRLGDRRYRVIGVLEPLGQSLGLDFSDIAVIPVASAENLFNTSSLFRILVQAKGRDSIAKAKIYVRDTIRARHDGEDDVTVITQDSLLSTFDDIFNALTYTVGGIAAVSLAVAGILIMNVMLVAVSQRSREIGLLKAVGASSRQVLGLFVAEAALLSILGAMIGLAMGQGMIFAMARFYPEFPIAAPLWAPIAAVSVAVVSGLVFGWLPAKRAAKLDPVLALSGR
jgi:putative ABC transport system permease protein